MTTARALCLVLLLQLVCIRSQAQSELGVLPSSQLTPGVALPDRIARREQQLRQELTLLRAQDRYRPLIQGLVLGVGGLALTLGTIYVREAGGFLLPLGVLATARGVLSFTLLPGRTKQVNAYLSAPMYTPAQVRSRIEFGEAVLAEQARRARTVRLADGSIALFAAAAYVPLAWGISRATIPGYRYGEDGFDYVVLTFAVIQAASALTTFFSPSVFEQRHAAYRDLVARQEHEQPDELEGWSERPALHVAPRIALRAGLRF